MSESSSENTSAEFGMPFQVSWLTKRASTDTEKRIRSGPWRCSAACNSSPAGTIVATLKPGGLAEVRHISPPLFRAVTRTGGRQLAEQQLFRCARVHPADMTQPTKTMATDDAGDVRVNTECSR